MSTDTFSRHSNTPTNNNKKQQSKNKPPVYLHCFNKNCKLIPQIEFQSPNMLSLKCPCTENKQPIPINILLDFMEAYENKDNNIYRINCPSHYSSKRNEPYIVYCKTCYKSLCAKCIADHCNHEIHNITELTKDFDLDEFGQLFEDAVYRYKRELNMLKDKVLEALEQEKKRIEECFLKNKEFNQNIISLFVNAMKQNDETPYDYHTVLFLKKYQNFEWKAFPIEEFKISKEHLQSLYSYLENTSILSLGGVSNKNTPLSKYSLKETPMTKQTNHMLFTPTYKTQTAKTKKSATKTPFSNNDNDNDNNNKSNINKNNITNNNNNKSKTSESELLKFETPKEESKRYIESPPTTPFVNIKLNEIQFLRRAEVHEMGITCICNIDNNRFVTSSRDCSIKIFTFDPIPFTKLDFNIENAHLNGVSYLCPSKNNTLISSGYDKQIKIWEITAKHYKLKQTLDGHSKCVYQVLTLSHDRFASCSQDKTIRIWELGSNYSLKQTLYGHNDTITSIIQRKDKEILVSGSDDQNLIFWDLVKYKKVNMLQNVYCACQTSLYEFEEGILLVGGKGCVKVVNMDMGVVTGDIKDIFFRGLKIFSVVSVGKRIIIGSEDGRIAIAELNAEKLIMKMKDAHDDFISGMIVLNQRIIVSASFDKTIKVWKF